jgi:hypothetical protein
MHHSSQAFINNIFRHTKNIIEHKLITIHKRGSKHYKPHNTEFHILQIFFKPTETRCEKIDEKFCWKNWTVRFAKSDSSVFPNRT